MENVTNDGVAGWTAGRRQSSWLGAVIAALVVIGAFVFVWMSPNHDKTPTSAAPAASTPASVPPTAPPMTPAPTATAKPAGCTWTANTDQNSNLVKTGTPPVSGLPKSGTRDMILNTTQGKITITLDVTRSPCAAASFTYLAGKKYFDNSKCHRLTTSGIFVLQCGDPSGTGAGGPSYTFAGENFPGDSGTTVTYPAGVVALANPGDRDRNGSQFFIVYQDSQLSADYTIIGTVTGGMGVLTKVAAGGVVPVNSPTDGTPKLPVKITTATVGPVKP